MRGEVLNLPTFEMMSARHVKAVARIEEQSFACPWSEAAFEAELANRAARYIVAIEDGAVVGYAGYWRIFDEAHITNVAVRPDMRGKGHGRRVMEELVKLAKSEGVSAMTLEVRVSNLTARALYASMGFASAGIRPDYYEDNGEDAVIMWCRFSERIRP
ncbi:MAG: N-acyltransferase YncA [Firmicutes bacterium ADurb.Bin153]|nr:MAG: N-acyltransferase YncA [Firmicutes bacterium ADurb.Bin153]